MKNLPLILLGTGVLGLGAVLIFSKNANAALPPGPITPATKAKVAAKIATTNDPDVLKQLAAGLQQAGATSQALDALQKAADITGQVQQVPGAASLPPITVTPGGGSMMAKPGMAGASSYHVANGDIPGAIAKRFGVTLSQLAGANGPKKARIMGGMIRVNEDLTLPPNAVDSGPRSRATGIAS